MEHIVLTNAKEKMEKSIAIFEKELAHIRAGRANPRLLDSVKVDYYGTPTPINQVGNISSPEPRLLVISPWDSSLIVEIEKAIMRSDIGINPSNDGKVIRLVFPELTQERRKELVKVLKKKGEETKVAVRSIRRDANELLKKEQKDSEITEDDLKELEEDVQKETDKFIKSIDKMMDSKETEIMEV
ncbi:MAG: ribosome recycling factor [Eubacteriales bacterium]